jgi:hypothetical protein
VDFFALIPQKAKTGYCCVKLCRNKPRKRSHDGRFCRRCRDRRYKLLSPISYAWDKLRYSAKRRDISFTLTMPQFKSFCAKTGYILSKGKTAESLSVDRIEAHLGYSATNIQALTLTENSRKSHIDRKLASWKPTGSIDPPDEGDPF